MTALASLPQAKLATHAEIGSTPRGREIRVLLENKSDALAFQLHGAIRTSSGGLIAPVIWSDNWIELVPGESRTLTALLPEDAGSSPVLQIDGWNIAPETITPTVAAASDK
jgi:exo-1,4-beta-D-glucosaminidase